MKIDFLIASITCFVASFMGFIFPHTTTDEFWAMIGFINGLFFIFDNSYSTKKKYKN